ncbi:MAG: trypsin-like serine protease [Pseudomonadota bacterium]
MLRFLSGLFAIAICATSVAAQDKRTGLVSLDSRQATQGWEAVGRLDINGQGFCTAALIEDRLLLTAAHCVYDQFNRPIPANQFLFQAGLRNGRADATRGIVQVIAHPDYQPDGPIAKIDGVANDIAILELAQPIRYAGVQPFPVAARPDRGDQVAIVSYGKDRSEAPSLQKACSILSRLDGALVMDCQAEFGSSGSPVFKVENGRAQIVSVVSAVGESGGNVVSLGTSLQEPLATLLDTLAASGSRRHVGDQRVLSIGERNETGAKFIRP